MLMEPSRPTQYSFIHSGYFHIAPLRVHYYSEALPTTARILNKYIMSDIFCPIYFVSIYFVMEPVNHNTTGTEITEEVVV